jgi:aldehyde:ferredoxin oxidoreductase
VATRYCGFMGEILDVDLSTGRVSRYPMSDDDYAMLLGGKALGARILYDIVPPGADPLGPDNALVFTSGVLNGTGAPCSGRYNVSTKNALTHGIASANSGGTFGMYLKWAGFDGLILRGRADHPVWVEVLEGQVKIHDARHLWGLDTKATQAALPKNVSTAVIGPAGENLVRFASIVNGHRALARCGVGAVMGSKQVKAITAGGSRRIPIHDRDGFAKSVADWTKVLQSHPTTGVQLPAYGTAALANITNATHTFATRNFSSGHIENADGLSGETMAETILKSNGACRSCPIRCSREKVEVDGKVMRGPEFETVGLMGANLGHTDLAMVCRLNEACDLLGMDTISCGGTLGFAMELSERGMLESDLRFGKTDNLLQTVDDIAHRRGLGDELAEGSMRVAMRRGGLEFAPQAKGMEFAAYEPRGAVGHGLGYAVSNRGACHINGGYMIFFEATGGLTMDPLTPLGKPGLTVFQQNMFDAVASAGCCIFTTYAVIPGGGEKFISPHGLGGKVFNEVLKASRFLLGSQGRLPAWALPIHVPMMIPHTKVIATASGINCTLGHFTLAGERAYTIERMFNIREGFDTRDDALPARITDEPQRSWEPNSRVPLKEMLPVYYQVRDWDPQGFPTERLLGRLGLGSMVLDLRRALRDNGREERLRRMEAQDRGAHERLPEIFSAKAELEKARKDLGLSIRRAERVERAKGVRESGFRISWAKCQRCGLCAEACPVEAISWKKGGLAEIDQTKCIHCGKCEATCPPRFSAVARFAAEGVANRAHGPIYRVVMGKCGLCGFCIKKCPVNAISWKRTMTRKEMALIDEDVCVRCGDCVTQCLQNNPEKVNAIDVIVEA